MTEPDAWIHEQSRENVESTVKVARTDKADSSRVQAYLTQTEKIENEEPLFSESTIQGLWRDDFKPVLIGEAKELRERGEEDVADQIEHTVERFEEVFSSDES